MFKSYPAPKDLCDAMLKLSNTGDWVRIERDQMKFNLKDFDANTNSMLVSASEKILAQYCSDFGIFKPANYRWEGGKLKQYSPGDHMAWHTDASHPNTCHRMLGFLWYLNDDFTGGETEYANQFTMTPKECTVLVFPPTWQFTHRALAVKEGKKLIATNYMSVA